jgi:DNA-binding PadR family transcriptional regulator
MTGYEIKQAFDSALSFFSGASYGSIYPTLGKLEKGGMARVKKETREGRHRKVYSITPSGQKTFKSALGGELGVPPFKNEFLTRLFFFESLKPPRREEITEEYIAFLEGKLAALGMVAPIVEAQADAYQKMCYRFGLRLTESFIEHTQQTLKELREQHKRKK